MVHQLSCDGDQVNKVTIESWHFGLLHS